MELNIPIPEDIQVTVEGNKFTVSKDQQSLDRAFPVRVVSITVKDREVIIKSFSEVARSRAMVGTFRAHVNNMIKGLQDPFVSKLKVCAAHFPMTVKRVGGEVQLQNFLGEKKVRKVKISEDVNVKIEGQDITISASDIEAAGAAASKIEQMTRLCKKDRRVFQDGIFMTEKAGKKI